MEGAQKTYALSKTFNTPAHISSLAFGHAGHLFAGSDDGCLRVYDLTTNKVIKAVRSLGNEVSSIVCLKRSGEELRDAWVAHGRKLSKFQLSSEKMIQNLDDALITLDVGEDDLDVLNELALNVEKSYLALSFDSGTVAIVDLATSSITRMGQKHESICGSVIFVPGRSRELISAGYDTKILHFDVSQNRVLSQHQIGPFDVAGGMALAPPFVMSTAMSTTGILAAGTADGRLFIGFGGEWNSSLPHPKKKPKKWEGLNVAESLTIKVAEGPIVAVAFSEARTLVISTLMGVITIYRIVYEEVGSNVVLQQLWQQESEGLQKVNALLTDDRRIIIGGFAADQRGVIEIWQLQITSNQAS